MAAGSMDLEAPLSLSRGCSPLDCLEAVRDVVLAVVVEVVLDATVFLLLDALPSLSVLDAGDDCFRLDRGVGVASCRGKS